MAYPLIATAIGLQAIEHHQKSVRSFSTVEPVDTLKSMEELVQSRFGSLMPIS